MLLRNRLHNPNGLIAVGQLSLATAIVAQRFIHPPTDFWQGFVTGLCGVLLGVSIVCNACGLVRWRLNRQRGE